MNSPISIEQCQSFINCQLRSGGRAARESDEGTTWKAITISRQAGSGGHTVAEKLIGYLQAQSPGASRPWVVFDRNLVEKVLEDHNLPGRLARFMPEDAISEISDTMDELFGLHPPSLLLVRKTADTILHLAQLGNVVLIGRGAHVITSKLAHVFHVRLVGSLEKRVRRLQELNDLSSKAAAELAHREDLGRQRYLKKYFNKDIEDPLLYHVVINTDLISYEEAARMISLAVAPKAMALAA
jgi:cytidylate kinase